MTAPTCLLVVARAPVAGQAKTRLGAAIGPYPAARLAAAALLDTLDAVLATPGVLPVVAMTGLVSAAERGAELTRALSHCALLPQRGANLAERLANAHADVAGLFPGSAVLQIGMDTPQASAEVFGRAIDALHAGGVDAVLGPATDGGWWALGLRSPADARVLRAVPMSRSDTGVRTLLALREAGLRVDMLGELSDVDTMADAVRVAALAPGTRFALAVAGIAEVTTLGRASRTFRTGESYVRPWSG